MRKRRRLWRLSHAAGFVLAAASLYQTSWAQQQGPLVIGQREKRETLKFDYFHAAVELNYLQQDSSVDTANGESQTFKEERWEERVSAWTHGYIVHPNLVELNLAGMFAPVQDSVDNNGVNQSEDGNVYTWDLNALILQKQEAPITLYSRRQRDLINREFGPSIDETVTTTGGVVDWRNKVVPTRIEAYHQDQEMTSADQTENLSISQDTFNWHSEAHPTKNQALNFDYTYNSISETGPAQPLVTTGNTLSYDSHDVTASHSWDFGPKQKNNLTSSVSYLNQSGDFSVEHLRWLEWLRLRHTDSFETQYRYTLDQLNTEQAAFTPGTIQTSEQTLQRAEAGFTHRLYKSLTTTGNAGLQTVDYGEGASTDELFATLSFDYRKKVPLGLLSAVLGFGYDTQDNTARGTTQVLNESHTFMDPLPIVISGRGIMPNSVIITDPTGRFFFRPGRDYQIRTFPDHLEIQRVVGGNIPNNSTVLIDYALEPEPANTVTTDSFNVGARYDISEGFFKGLGVYAKYIVVDQSISSDVPSAFVPNSLTDTVFGAEYRRDGLRVGAEQEFHDSTIAPYDTTRFFGEYARPLGAGSIASVLATYNIIDFREPTDHATLLNISGNWSQRISRTLTGVATVTWRDETDELVGDTTGLEEQLQVRWDRGQFHVVLMFRNATLDTDAQSSSFQILQLSVMREF